MRIVQEAAVALAVVNGVDRLRHADRQRRGAPQFAAVLVAQVQHLMRRVADWIVGPRRQRILLAVE